MSKRRDRARPSTPVFAALAALFALLIASVLHAGLTTQAQNARLAASADLVARVGLSDLALFTEARYTRHPALADLHTPFQDNPVSFEHFPSGSFVPVPTNLGAGVFDAPGEEARP